MKDDNNKNNLSKKYKFSLLGDSNQGLSRRTSPVFTTLLQMEIQDPVQVEEILSIYTKNVRADREFTHLLAKNANFQTVLVTN